MKPPEKPQMAPYFIDRHNYVKTFFHWLQQREIVQFVGDTYSRYGTGKTTVLSTLYYLVAGHSEFMPLWLSLDQFSIHYQNPSLAESNSPHADLMIRVQNVIDYQALLVELARESLPHLGTFPQTLERIALDVIRQFFGSDRELHTSAADTWKQLMEEVQESRVVHRTLENAINEAVARLTREFLGYFNPSVRADQRVILFADDYCWISEHPIGDWVLNDLTGQMQNTWVIVSRTTPQLNVEEASRRIENLFLSNFTPEEVAAYLHKRLGLQQLPPMMAENIHHFTRGHPQEVSLVADLLQSSLEGGSLQRADFPRWEEGQYEEIIPTLLLRLIEDTHNPWLREALWVGIITRRFDADLLYRVLMASADYRAPLMAGLLHEEDVEERPIAPGGEAGQEDDDFMAHPLAPEIKERILNAVTRYSFVEQHRDEHGIFYAFHNIMRGVVNDYLKANRPEDYTAFHQKLVDAYSEILAAYEEQDPAERFVALYRYEDPTWQRMVSEWLYHVSAIRDREEADLEFLNVYFLAFQWWEYYLPFPFCEHLLKHWGWIQGSGGNSSPVYGLVRTLHEVYPRGFSREVRGDPRWDEVRKLTEQIAGAFHLLDAQILPVKQHALRAALEETYSSALRFGPQPNYAEAERHYREVIQGAVEDGDPYNQSYETAYLADMLLEMGRYDDAFAEAARVNELLDAEGPFAVEKDYEVLTLSYRVMGDARLFQGRYDEVAPFYRRASMCGYAQNFALMHPPDPYTVKWYDDNSRWMAVYLVQAARTDDILPQVEAICHAVHAVWESFWQVHGCPVETARMAALLRAGDVAGVRAFMAPPAPDLHAGSVFPAELLQEEHNRVAALFGIARTAGEHDDA